MTPRYAVPLAAATLVLAGCGAPFRGAAAPSGGHALTVTMHLAPGEHHAMFTEGAVPEFRLVDHDGRVLTPADDHRPTAEFRGLAAGLYTLRAVLRPCDGNCGYLDEPLSPCRGVVRVPDNGAVAVHWRVGEGACRIVPA